MTGKSSKYFRRSYSPTSAPLSRPSKSAPFGSASARPPSSRPPPSLSSRTTAPPTSPAPPNLRPVIDEANWFGVHDQAEAEEAAGRSMAALVGRIIGAKPFPISARKLADLTRNDVVRIEPVIQVLESDPGLSARLLRLVNSAGYALRQRCTSVRHAATLVGTDRLHQIATTAAVLDLFDSKGPVAAQIIEHSTMVGAFCRYLGAHLALPVDDLFTAGFLHDIGKLMLMETEGDRYVEVFTTCASQPDTLHLLERSMYGFDHAALAAHVLSAWNIPDPVPKIVAWHHEPAQAYKMSSLMASLVETVRLSDALVYAIRQSPERSQAKVLAEHEAARYLEISEPQLAAMWDELRVLYDESHQQCQGENAPALDPRSLRPKQPLSIAASRTEDGDADQAHDLPKQFPCVACGGPTFGNTCSACGGYVCPDHQVGENEWCSVCAEDYLAEKKSIPVPVRAKWAFGALAAAVGIAGILGMVTEGRAGAIRAGVGTLLLGSLMGLVYVILKTWFVRKRFVGSRPNRYTAEPQVNDGGTQSLVPPAQAEADSEGAPKIVWPQPNVLLVEPLKEITIREITGNQDDSPKSPQLQTSSVRESRLDSVDPERVQLQRESLVTVPAPAVPTATTPDDPADDEDVPETEQGRRPRDTLTEQDISALSDAAGSQNWNEDIVRDQVLATRERRSIRKTDPGPEAQFARPFVTFRDARPSPSASEQSADISGTSAPWDPYESRREAVTEPSRVGSNDETQPPANDSAGSEIHAVAKPILVVGSEPSNADQGVPDGRGTVEDRDPLRFVTPASVHPLAALGIRSQPPCSVSNVPEPEFSEPPVAVTKPAEPDEPEVKQVPAAATLEPSLLEMTEPKLEKLVGEFASHLGSDFEARVKELAAQRIAEKVAERFMASFDVSSLIKDENTAETSRPKSTAATKTTRRKKRAPAGEE